MLQPAKKESTQELRSGYKTLHYWITILTCIPIPCGLKPCYYKQIACFSNCYNRMKLTVLNYWNDRKFDRLSINVQLLTVNTLATAIIPKSPQDIIPSVKYSLFAIHVSDLIPGSRYKTLPTGFTKWFMSSVWKEWTQITMQDLRTDSLGIVQRVTIQEIGNDLKFTEQSISISITKLWKMWLFLRRPK